MNEDIKNNNEIDETDKDTGTKDVIIETNGEETEPNGEKEKPNEEIIEKEEEKIIENKDEKENNIDETIIKKLIDKALEEERKKHTLEKNKIILEGILKENKIPEKFIDKFNLTDIDTKETLNQKVQDYITEITEVSKALNNKVIIPDTGVDTNKKNNKKQSFYDKFLNL